MKLLYILISTALLFSHTTFAQNLDDEFDLDSEIDQELTINTDSPLQNDTTDSIDDDNFSDEAFNDDIANSLEDDEFSEGTLKEDIANSIEDDEFSEGTLKDDIANSIEDDEFSNDSVDNDIANNLDEDEGTPLKQKNLSYQGKITPYSKKEKLIDHPHASKGLYKITKDREYIYTTRKSEQKNNASLRFGLLSPTNLQTENGFFFDEIYDNPKSPMILFDWEWQLKFLGRMSFKLGTGLYFADGNGRFNSSLAPAGQRPLEEFSLFMSPNSANLVYKFQFWNNQFLVPYADAGVDAFAIMEFQDGKSIPKLGGSLGGHFSVGLALSIGFLDKWSVIELDRDYGINSIYIVGEFRNYFHIAGSYNFSGTFVNGGLAFDF